MATESIQLTHCNMVLNTSWNNDIGNVPLGINVLQRLRNGPEEVRTTYLLEIRLHKCKPLLDDAVYIATAIPDISQNFGRLEPPIPNRITQQHTSSGETCVCVGLTEYLPQLALRPRGAARTCTFISSRFRILGSYRAKMPSRMMTCGEYIAVLRSIRACFSKE